MFENNEDEVHGALGRADIPAMISHTGFGSWPNSLELSGPAHAAASIIAHEWGRINHFSGRVPGRLQRERV